MTKNLQAKRSQDERDIHEKIGRKERTERKKEKEQKIDEEKQKVK